MRKATGAEIAVGRASETGFAFKEEKESNRVVVSWHVYIPSIINKKINHKCNSIYWHKVHAHA